MSLDSKASAQMGTAFIEVTVPGDLTLVSNIREGILSVLRGIGSDDELLGRLEVAIHELMENAVKGSSDKRARFRVELFQRNAEIHTWNRGSSFDLEVLKRSLIGFDSLEGAKEDYLRVMKETSTRTEGSGLGLHRIRAEAQMTIQCDNDGPLIHVMAKTVAPAAGRTKR